MAFRNLGRNRRRTILSALALTLGVTLLLFMAAFVEGEMRSAMESSLRLQSGHIQVRPAGYEEDKLSLAWEDLIQNPAQAAAQLAALEQVADAAPRLMASGILSVRDETLSVEVLGVDPASLSTAPYREGLVSGEFPAADDRDGILVGYPLADNLGLSAGSKVSLLMNTSDGSVNEQLFTVRGVYSTGTPTLDKTVVLMPLAKAQAMAGTQDRASIIFVLLEDREQAAAVAAAIQGPRFEVKTWQEMNELLVQTEDFSNAYMVVINLVVLGVTATVIVNTLVMFVFERTREVGVLAAIGMKGRQIMALFLAEAGLLALGGIGVGLALGWALCAYFEKQGIYLGDLGMTGIPMGERIYTYLTLEAAVSLVLTALVVTLLASLYPARLAARMEPVEALHGSN
jgi:ABC-type lipoprotein release transport system permease subunit